VFYFHLLCFKNIIKFNSKMHKPLTPTLVSPKSTIGLCSFLYLVSLPTVVSIFSRNERRKVIGWCLHTVHYACKRCHKSRSEFYDVRSLSHHATPLEIHYLTWNWNASWPCQSSLKLKQGKSAYKSAARRLISSSHRLLLRGKF